jgi:hypothetical protein
MAYTNNSNPSTNNNNNIGNAGRPQRAKSEGAINIYMPNLNGTRAQLGTLWLNMSDPAHAAMMADLNVDAGASKAVLERIVSKLIVEYRAIADKKDAGGFDY